MPARPACASSPKPTAAEGVTADTVKVGVLFLDIKKLADLGFAVDPGPTQAILQGLLEAPNATGGICGRKIQATAVSFDGLTQGGDAQACSKITEDSRQFVILAVSGVSTPALRCLADQGKTLTITDAQGPQSFADGVAGRVFSAAGELDASLAAAPRMMADAGLLKNTGKVGLIYGGGADNDALVKATETNVLAELERYVGKVVTCPMPGGAASPEGAAALPLCAEKFAAAGVKTIVSGLDIYSFSLFSNEAKKQGLSPRYLNVGGWTCCDTTTSLFFKKVSQPVNFEGLVSIQTDRPNTADPYIDGCLKRVGKLGLKPATADMTDFQRTVAVNYCYFTDLVLYGLAAAGAAPTEASYISGLEKMPPSANAHGFNGSFGPHKHFFLDEMRLAVYSAANDVFTPFNQKRYAIG